MQIYMNMYTYIPYINVYKTHTEYVYIEIYNMCTFQDIIYILYAYNL